MKKDKRKPLITIGTINEIVEILTGCITIVSFVVAVIKGIVEWLA